jgi:hypothetical protein
MALIHSWVHRNKALTLFSHALVNAPFTPSRDGCPVT